MGKNRLKLHDILSSIPGIEKAYYNPPEGLKLEYPCIIYEDATRQILHANNGPYSDRDSYSILIIDPDPESTIPTLFEQAIKRYWSPGKPYDYDELSHWPYTIYF